MKVVIVGGVAGGASAAARIRRLDEHAQIIMIERSGYVSYANCGLPYYVGGVIKISHGIKYYIEMNYSNQDQLLHVCIQNCVCCIPVVSIFFKIM